MSRERLNYEEVEIPEELQEMLNGLEEELRAREAALRRRYERKKGEIIGRAEMLIEGFLVGKGIFIDKVVDNVVRSSDGKKLIITRRRRGDE